MIKRFYQILETELGALIIVSDGTSITEVKFSSEVPDGAKLETLAVLEKAKLQLTEYFAGKRTEFDLPLAPQGTTFQKDVWQVLLKIPYGKTINYAHQAKQLNKPNASRAVGAANGKNPIAIIIPCHRVIGKNGSLTGYAGGIKIKEKLLILER